MYRNQLNDSRTKSGRILMKAIRQVALQIADRFTVEKIILFGSYASGKPKRTSDIDMLVVMETKKRSLRQSFEIIQALSPLYFGIDLVVRSEKEIQRRIQIGDQFIKEIVNKGVVLYEG